MSGPERFSMPPPKVATVFVAHPFSAIGKAVVQREVLPALERLNFVAVFGPSKDCGGAVSAVRSAIDRADALIGVITGVNPNVFFEIGLASALGKRCLMLAKDPADLAMLAGAYPSVIGFGDAASGRRLTSILASWRHGDFIHPDLPIPTI